MEFKVSLKKKKASILTEKNVKGKECKYMVTDSLFLHYS